MKLMTKALQKRFAVIGFQQDAIDPIVVAKYFNPAGAGTWYVTEYEPDTNIFFGYVSIFGDHNDEWGYFSLNELEAFKGPLGIGIERDFYWSEKRFSKVIGNKNQV